MKKLAKKNCKNCNSSVLTFAKNPLCHTCMKARCQLSHMKDSLGRNTCNTIRDLVQRKHCLCVGHYKLLQNYCYVCGIPKLDDDILSYDDYYYCKKHKPVNQSKFIHRYFQSVLDFDSINNILEYT